MNPQALIVDDEPDILDLLSMTLSGMSIDCVTAESIAEAERLLAQQSFDLCFTDMRLPDGDEARGVRQVCRRNTGDALAERAHFSRSQVTILMPVMVNRTKPS